jgi:hypothetical protein
MRLRRASLILAVLLVASLAGKGFALRASEGIVAGADGPDMTAFLAGKGMTVTVASADTAPVWFTGTKGNCQVRIADVSPQGWARTIVAQEGAGQEVRYAFGGTFHADQPVMATTLAEYGNRLFRYLGFAAPRPIVRAVLISRPCPPKTIVPEDALALS